MKDLLISYTAYNLWANRKLLDFISTGINDEKQNITIISSFPSVLKTVLHLRDAEFIWLMRMNGVSVRTWPESHEKNTSEVAKQIIENGNGLIDYVKSKSEEEIASVFSYSTLDGTSYTNPLWQSILHCMNHSTFHRGQLITMLRQLGYANLPKTDYIAFIRV